MTVPSTAFIDRDGVINQKPADGRYVLASSDLVLLPGAGAAIASLNAAGVRTVIVTNQQCVGKGLLTLEELDAINGKVLEAVKAEGGRIDQVLVCPHLEGTCECRKPRVGMFVEARRRDPGIDFSDAVVIGDSPSDMEAAATIGARRILVCPDGQKGPLDGNEGPSMEVVSGLSSAVASTLANGS